MTDQSVARDLTTIAELTAAICLAPCADEPRDRVAPDEAEELHRVAREVKHHFDRFLPDAVRADIAQFIQHLEDNRESYR